MTEAVMSYEDNGAPYISGGHSQDWVCLCLSASCGRVGGVIAHLGKAKMMLVD